jgi:hypothetical protein
VPVLREVVKPWLRLCPARERSGGDRVIEWLHPGAANLEKLIILVIFLSLLPGIISYLRAYLAKSNEKPAT